MLIPIFILCLSICGVVILCSFYARPGPWGLLQTHHPLSPGLLSPVTCTCHFLSVSGFHSFFFLLSSIWICRKLIYSPCSGNIGLKNLGEKLSICFSEVIKNIDLLSEDKSVKQTWKCSPNGNSLKCIWLEVTKTQKMLKTTLRISAQRRMPVPSANQRWVSGSHFLFVLLPRGLLWCCPACRSLGIGRGWWAELICHLNYGKNSIRPSSGSTVNILITKQPRSFPIHIVMDCP